MVHIIIYIPRRGINYLTDFVMGNCTWLSNSLCYTKLPSPMVVICLDVYIGSYGYRDHSTTTHGSMNWNAFRKLRRPTGAENITVISIVNSRLTLQYKYWKFPSGTYIMTHCIVIIIYISSRCIDYLSDFVMGTVLDSPIHYTRLTAFPGGRCLFRCLSRL